VGIVSEADLLEFVGSGDGDAGSVLSKCMKRQCPVVGPQTPISALQETLRKTNAAVVVDQGRRPIGILTRIDLLHFLNEHPAVKS
jgi:cystathionine beta-synthase